MGITPSSPFLGQRSLSLSPDLPLRVSQWDQLPRSLDLILELGARSSTLKLESRDGTKSQARTAPGS